MASLVRPFIKTLLDEGCSNIWFNSKDGFKVHEFPDGQSLNLVQLNNVFHDTDETPSLRPRFKGYVLARGSDSKHQFWVVLNRDATTEYQKLTGMPFARSARHNYVQVHISKFYFVEKQTLDIIATQNKPVLNLYNYLIIPDDETVAVPIFEASRCILACPSTVMSVGGIHLEDEEPVNDPSKIIHLRTHWKPVEGETLVPPRARFLQKAKGHFLSPGAASSPGSAAPLRINHLKGTPRRTPARRHAPLLTPLRKPPSPGMAVAPVYGFDSQPSTANTNSQTSTKVDQINLSQRSTNVDENNLSSQRSTDVEQMKTLSLRPVNVDQSKTLTQRSTKIDQSNDLMQPTTSIDGNNLSKGSTNVNENNLLQRSTNVDENNLLQRSTNVDQNNLRERSTTVAENNMLPRSTNVDRNNLRERSTTVAENNLLQRLTNVDLNNLSQRFNFADQNNKLRPAAKSGKPEAMRQFAEALNVLLSESAQLDLPTRGPEAGPQNDMQRRPMKRSAIVQDDTPNKRPRRESNPLDLDPETRRILDRLRSAYG
jgi:hypothetical protein